MQVKNRDLSGYSKKLTSGIQPQYSNNIKNVKYNYQINASQSQKNMKISSPKKIDLKSRPNTGGSKSAVRNNTPLTYKEKSRLKYLKNLKQSK